jgi:RNA polymerase sigma-70 factor (ECF subfamily)
VKHLLEEHLPAVYRFARRLTHDAHAAEDLTQETFLRAWRKRQLLRDPRAARVWLFTIAANVWRDQVRRASPPAARPSSLVEDPPGPARSPDHQAERQEELARAREALDALPPRQREALYLSACEGLSPAEVAGVLGISPEAAKASVSLARKKLRQKLCDIFEDLFPTPDPMR